MCARCVPPPRIIRRMWTRRDAFDRLLDYLAAGHRDQMETVRVRLLEYFAIPDPSDERLKRARRRLATLMY